MPKNPHEDTHNTILEVADVIGGLMEFWGFKRPMGRMWTLLYLSPDALTAAELGERLSMSAGAVSMAVSELTKWGVVRRTWKPGDRKDFFEAETNIWKMVTRVFRERELRLIREAADTFDRSVDALARTMKTLPKADARRLEFVRRRLSLLSSLTKIGEHLLNAILENDRVDTKALQRFSAEADSVGG